MAGSRLDLKVVDEPRGFDAARARLDFPILSREVNGKPLVYLDLSLIHI